MELENYYSEILDEKGYVKLVPKDGKPKCNITITTNGNIIFQPIITNGVNKNLCSSRILQITSVLEYMINGSTFPNAVKTVSADFKVEDTTIRDKCTRQLHLTAAEFASKAKDYIENNNYELLDIMKQYYSNKNLEDIKLIESFYKNKHN